MMYLAKYVPCSRQGSQGQTATFGFTPITGMTSPTPVMQGLMSGMMSPPPMMMPTIPVYTPTGKPNSMGSRMSLCIYLLLCVAELSVSACCSCL